MVRAPIIKMKMKIAGAKGRKNWIECDVGWVRFQHVVFFKIKTRNRHQRPTFPAPPPRSRDAFCCLWCSHCACCWLSAAPGVGAMTSVQGEQRSALRRITAETKGRTHFSGSLGLGGGFGRGGHVEILLRVKKDGQRRMREVRKVLWVRATLLI